VLREIGGVLDRHGLIGLLAVLSESPMKSRPTPRGNPLVEGVLVEGMNERVLRDPRAVRELGQARGPEELPAPGQTLTLLLDQFQWGAAHLGHGVGGEFDAGHAGDLEQDAG